MQHNRVTRVSGIQDLPVLSVLDLSHNSLGLDLGSSDKRDICLALVIQTLPASLCILNVLENPGVSSSSEKDILELVRKHCPEIVVFNSQEVDLETAVSSNNNDENLRGGVKKFQSEAEASRELIARLEAELAARQQYEEKSYDAREHLSMNQTNPCPTNTSDESFFDEHACELEFLRDLSEQDRLKRRVQRTDEIRRQTEQSIAQFRWEKEEEREERPFSAVRKMRTVFEAPETVDDLYSSWKTERTGDGEKIFLPTEEEKIFLPTEEKKILPDFANAPKNVRPLIDTEGKPLPQSKWARRRDLGGEL